ncbi:MAG: folylpolyglutamate synthase/dihydrofolate synthase family protein [Microcystaceae cyanobacterium]
MSIDSLLKSYQRFGVNLGLERIKTLLNQLGNPQQSVPIIHVAGTNGKGSVCAYLSSVLQEAGYKVGRYTSPHLIDWTERIQVNHTPIFTSDFEELLQEIESLIDLNNNPPTLFEMVTTVAWLYFKRSQVNIAVIETGLGGRLDATNVCDKPVATVITSISREHWQVLGDTLTKIATEKAGILKENCPAIIGQLPAEAELVFKEKTQALNCPTVWVKPAKRLTDKKAIYQNIDYTLPLLGDIQLINSAIAMATLQCLQQQGWQISATAIKQGIAQTNWLGRLQWFNYNNRDILIDGAHNPAAAQGLAHYAHQLNQPITWVMGMLSTKEHREILKFLLRKGDNLYLVPVQDHSTANPKALASLAQEICPDLREVKPFKALFEALDYGFKQNDNSVIVLCGSLYLVGYFFKHIQSKS